MNFYPLNPEHTYDFKEAAAFLRLRPGSMERLIAEGLIPFYLKTTGVPVARRRFRIADLLAYEQGLLSTGTQKSPAAKTGLPAPTTDQSEGDSSDGTKRTRRRHW